MVDWGGEFSILQGIHVSFDIRIDISKTYDHQIWQAGTSTGFDSNKTNQAGARDFTTSRSCDKLKTLYLH